MEDPYDSKWISLDDHISFTKRMLLQPYARPQENGSRNRAELLYTKARKSLYNRGVVVSPSILLSLLKSAIGKENYTKVELWHSGIDADSLKPNQTGGKE